MNNLKPLTIIGFLLVVLVIALDLTIVNANPVYIYILTPFSFFGILVTLAWYYGDE